MGVLDWIADQQTQRELAQGAMDAINRGAIGGLLGMPVDMANGLLNAGKMAAGYLGHEAGLLRPEDIPQPDTMPIGGSEWFGKKMQDLGMVSPNRNIPAEFLAGMAGVPAMAKTAAVAGPAIERSALAALENAMEQNFAEGGAVQEPTKSAAQAVQDLLAALRAQQEIKMPSPTEPTPTIGIRG